MRVFIRQQFQSPALWSIFQEFAYQFTPLLRGGVFGIFNPNDKSYVIVPTASYSIITNFDFYFTRLFFAGDALAEYGDYGSTLFLRLKYSF